MMKNFLQKLLLWIPWFAVATIGVMFIIALLFKFTLALTILGLGAISLFLVLSARELWQMITKTGSYKKVTTVAATVIAPTPATPAA